ncbi:MAG: ferrous iron transporter B [Bdellovibrionaceae bacterium]|nr:ferrous iron transporter B [Pseudobdellovibrionaceae bacterium]
MKTYVLIGTPNSGKTTFYNWLTGSHFKTVNYPGSTVEYNVGDISPDYGEKFKFIDTPGTYSLDPKGPDEEVTASVLFELDKENKRKNVILVVDGLHLGRSLVMALQLKKAGFPFTVVVTMHDLLEKYKERIDFSKLSAWLGADVFPFNGQTGEGLKEIIDGLKIKENFEVQKLNWTYLDQQQARNSIRIALNEMDRHENSESFFKTTHKVDAFILGRWGYAFFFIIMTVLFASLFWLATPFADGIEFLFAKAVVLLEAYFPASQWRDFITQALLSGFSSVLVFVPQIFLLFFGLGVLESSGYLPRAAALIDHPLRKMGLGGRAFVPLLSGFACAVPALMATRNISSRKERLLAMFVIPLMSCSARVPVFGLLIAFLVGDNVLVSGLFMALLYFASLLIGAIAALILSRYLPEGKDQFFLMELPIYRAPKWKQLVIHALQKTKSYVVRAGPIILFFSLVLWAGAQFPRNEMGHSPELAQSYVGRLGHLMEPFFKPMGVDWRVGVGLISAFAAREVFVSTLAVTMKVTADEETQPKELIEVMKSATFTDGSKIFTYGSVLGLIIFFIVALQCMSTVAVQIKESGSVKLALMQLASLNLVAYVLAVAVNQTYCFLFK